MATTTPKDAALALLRIGLAGMMLTHGIPKLQGYGERAATFPDPLGVGNATSLTMAIFAEVVCSLLLIPGIFVRLAAIPFCFTMVVAFFVVHGGDPFAKRELALVYLVGGLAISIGGGGRYSLDAWLAPRLRARLGDGWLARAITG